MDEGAEEILFQVHGKLSETLPPHEHREDPSLYQMTEGNYAALTCCMIPGCTEKSIFATEEYPSYMNGTTSLLDWTPDNHVACVNHLGLVTPCERTADLEASFRKGDSFRPNQECT